MNADLPSPDDIRLTTYALGELLDDDVASVEALLRENEAARIDVAEICALGDAIKSALQSEGNPERDANEPGPTAGKLRGGRLFRWALGFAAVIALVASFDLRLRHSTQELTTNRPVSVSQLDSPDASRISEIYFHPSLQDRSRLADFWADASPRAETGLEALSPHVLAEVRTFAMPSLNAASPWQPAVFRPDPLLITR